MIPGLRDSKGNTSWVNKTYASNMLMAMLWRAEQELGKRTR